MAKAPEVFPASFAEKQVAEILEKTGFVSREDTPPRTHITPQNLNPRRNLNALLYGFEMGLTHIALYRLAPDQYSLSNISGLVGVSIGAIFFGSMAREFLPRIGLDIVSGSLSFIKSRFRNKG